MAWMYCLTLYNVIYRLQSIFKHWTVVNKMQRVKLLLISNTITSEHLLLQFYCIPLKSNCRTTKVLRRSVSNLYLFGQSSNVQSSEWSILRWLQDHRTTSSQCSWPLPRQKHQRKIPLRQNNQQKWFRENFYGRAKVLQPQGLSNMVTEF